LIYGGARGVGWEERIAVCGLAGDGFILGGRIRA
jgi:hypothetical protein